MVLQLCGRVCRRLSFKNPVLTNGVFCFVLWRTEVRVPEAHRKNRMSTGHSPLNLKFLLISNCNYVGEYVLRQFAALGSSPLLRQFGLKPSGLLKPCSNERFFCFVSIVVWKCIIASVAKQSFPENGKLHFALLFPIVSERDDQAPA